MKMKFNFMILILSLSLVHCATTSNAGLALSNTPISQPYDIVSPVKKTKIWFTFDIGFIGIPLRKPPIDALMNDILTEKKADALVNIRYWNDRMVFLFLTVNRIGLSAEAVKFKTKENKKEQKRKKR